MMKINVAKSAGFCFGVKRALAMALKAAHERKNVVMLGDIVHNEDVVRSIQEAGIRKISRLSKTSNETLLIRAHGAANKTIARAQHLGYTVIDATCPMVKDIHKIAVSMETKGYTIIVIGDTAHDEVNGILGQLRKKAIVIEDPRTIPVAEMRKVKKACVVVQSTQNIEKVNKIISLLTTYVEKLEFFNTICQTTRLKQKEIQLMPGRNDVMIIIGSKTSANTRRLWEISRSINPKSYWVHSPGDLKARWFEGARKVGVTAGASTPDYTTQKVISRIRAL